MANGDGRPDGEAVATDDSVGLEEARANIGELVLRAGFGNKRIQITRHGKPLAVLVGMRDFERLQAMEPEP